MVCLMRCYFLLRADALSTRCGCALFYQQTMYERCMLRTAVTFSSASLCTYINILHPVAFLKRWGAITLAIVYILIVVEWCYSVSASCVVLFFMLQAHPDRIQPHHFRSRFIIGIRIHCTLIAVDSHAAALLLKRVPMRISWSECLVEMKCQQVLCRN